MADPIYDPLTGSVLRRQPAQPLYDPLATSDGLTPPTERLISPMSSIPAKAATSGFHGSIANIEAYGSSMAQQMGFNKLAENLKASALRRSQQAQEAAPPIMSYTQVDGLGSALDYGAAMVGQAAGSLVPIAAGAAIARTPGALATLLPMSGGEVVLRDAQNPTGADPAEVHRAATLHGGISAALGMAPIASIIGRGPLARLASAGTATPGARFATRTGTTALAEGAQEGFEEYTAQQAMRSLRGQPLGPADDPQAIKEAAVSGAVGMAPFGAVHGVAGGTRDAGGLGLRAAAEARRLAAEQADKVVQSPVGQAVKDIGEHVSGIAKDEFGKREGVAGAAVSLEAVGRRIYADRDAMGARFKEGLDEQGYEDRFTAVKEHAEKLADRKGFTEDEKNSKGIIESHGKDVIDMAARLRQRTDLTEEDRDALDLFDKERGGSAPGRAVLPHVRRPVAMAFLRTMERDRTAEISERMKLIKDKFAGTKKSLSPTGESEIDRLLVEIGFAPLPSPKETVEQDLSRQRALKAETARPKTLAEQYQTRRGEPVPQPTEATPMGPKPPTVRASSVADRAIWAMFDADYRDPGTVDRLSGHVDELVRRIAHGEASPEESVQAERGLVSMASTPESANQLRELFAKARELSTLDLNKKDQRKAFVKEMSELVTSKRLPYQEALVAFAKEAGSNPADLPAFIMRFERNMIRDDTRPRAEAEVQKMFGAENYGKALRILNALARPPENFAPDGANREAHNRPGLSVDERAPLLRDEAPDESDPDALATYLGYETREEDPETRGFGVIPTEEATGKSFVQNDAVPMSPHAPFRVPTGMPSRMSGVEAFRYRMGKDAGTGQLITRNVMDAVNEAQFDAADRGEEYDRKGELQRYYDAVRTSEEADAAAARDFLASKGEFTGRRLRNVDPDVVVPKIRAALAAENRKDGNPDFPETRDEAKILSKVRVDREMKEIEKYAGGDPEVAAALASIYRNEKHRSFGEQYGPAEFFQTYSHRLPGKRGHDVARAERLDRAIEKNLHAAEEARPEKGTIGVEVRVEDTNEWAYRVLDLPAYLAERVRADAKVVHRENLQGALASLILHLDKSDKFRLTDKAKATLGLDKKGRIDRDLLLFKDGKTTITGRDFSGRPMETPDSTPFRERYTEKDLTIKPIPKKGSPHEAAWAKSLKGGTPESEGFLSVADQRVNVPQEVMKAAQMHGATVSNLQRLNIAQIAGLLDRVFNALEKRFPNDFDRGALPEGLVLARRKQWSGDTKNFTMADFAAYGLNITPSAREAGPDMKTMEYSAEPEKTSELNLQSYLDMLTSRLENAAADMKKPAGERAMERVGPSERSQLDTEIRDLQNSIAGREYLLRTRKSDANVAMLAREKTRLSELIQQRTEQLAQELKVDETRAKLAAQEAQKEYENRDVLDGPWADPEFIGKAELRHQPNKLESFAERTARKQRNASRQPGAGLVESDENAVRPEKPGGEFLSKNVSDLVGIARSVAERLDSIRFGKPFDSGDILAEPVEARSQKLAIFERGWGYGEDTRRYTKNVTLSKAEDGKIESRLTDEEPPVVYHDPKAAPKAKPLPAEAYAEYEANKAKAAQKEEPPKSTQSMVAALEDNLSKMRALIEKKTLSPAQVAKQIEKMNVDVSAIDAFMRELPEGPYGRALNRELEVLVEKKVSDDVMFSRAATDPRGSQDDFGNDFKYEQYEAGLKEHIKKFGESAANTSTREMKQAGSYNPTTGELVISSIAASIGQAWAHEDIHHLFKLMREQGGAAGRVIETLIAATSKNTPAIQKARELLVEGLSEEDAKALLADFDGVPEERVAYLYQLRVAGLIDAINPPAEGAIKRIFRWLHDKLGFLSDEQKAENFLNAWEKGHIASEYKNPSALARAMGQESRLARAYDVVAGSLKPVVAAVANAFTPSYDRVLALNNPALTKVAELFGRRTPDEKGRQGYYWEREKLRMGLENTFAAIIESASTKERDAALQELFAHDPQSDLAKALDAELKKHGEVLPEVTDRKAVAERLDEWLADVKINGAPNKSAIQQALSGDKLDEYFGTGRALPNYTYLSAEKRAKWQVQSMDEWLGSAIRQMAAKQAREEVFGKDAESLKALLKEAREKHHASDDDMSVVKKFIAGVEGWAGSDMPEHFQSMQAAVTTGLNLFMLPLAITSAMVDPIYIGVRSGSMAEAWNAYALGLKSIVDTFGQKGGKLSGDSAKFAEDIRLIAQAGMTEPIADLFNGVGTSGLLRRVNKVFFRFNLLQGWEQAMFAASAEAGKRSIAHHGKLPDPKWSKVFLDELGLTPEDIQLKPNGDLAVFEGDGLTPEQARKIQSAIHAFSYQAAARPSAMSNSIWMNDRYYALLAHMKPFTMAQSAGVLDWMEKRVKAEDYAPLLRVLPAVPIAMMALAARSLFSGGTIADSPMSAFMRAVESSGIEGRMVYGDRVVSGLMANQGVYAFTGLSPVTSVAANALRGG